MPFNFLSAELPSISSSNTQLFNQKYKYFTAVDVQPHPWAAYSGFILNPYPFSFLYSPNVLPSLSNEYLRQEIVKPNIKPNKQTAVSTTRLPNSSSFASNNLFKNSDNDLKGDRELISAAKQVNPSLEIEKLKNKKVSMLKKAETKAMNQDSGNIKVEATGKTSTGNNVPVTSFGSYFLPYNSNMQSGDKKTSSLILQPSSKAIVGNGGTAISAPISRAIIKKGVPTNVFFNPESVAIAGVGGRAHAQADLILDVIDKRLERINNRSDVVSYPYYGGLKGHSLNISKDGKINTVVVLNPKYVEGRGTSDTYFNKIQDSAARLVAIQEKAKQKGSFSEKDNKLYADSLFELGIAAQGLAQLQQNGEIKDFSKLLQGSNTQIKPQPAKETPLIPETEEPSQNGDNMFVPATMEDPYDDSGESVSINAPKKDASVAEAKPIGLSIVGEGGVASSKPNAVAIAGREGLAVASPKATAIAGVSPEEAAAFSINVPTRNDIIIKAQQRENTSGVQSVQNISQLKTTNYPQSGNEAQKRKSAAMYDNGITILSVEPRFGDSKEMHQKHQTSKSPPSNVPKRLNFEQLPSNFEETKYNRNIALLNHLLTSYYSS